MHKKPFSMLQFCKYFDYVHLDHPKICMLEGKEKNHHKHSNEAKNCEEY